MMKIRFITCTSQYSRLGKTTTQTLTEQEMVTSIQKVALKIRAIKAQDGG